jgi:hypothetical protein
MRLEVLIMIFNDNFCVTKTYSAQCSIKILTIDISKQINKGKNKSNIENLEKAL